MTQENEPDFSQLRGQINQIIEGSLRKTWAGYLSHGARLAVADSFIEALPDLAKEAGYVKLAEDQTLPEIEHEVCTTIGSGTQVARDHYEAGWNNGLNKAKRLGWRKVEPGVK